MSPFCGLKSRLEKSELGVDTRDDTRLHYARTTLPKGTLPSGVVHPTSTSEVEAIVRFAREARIPLYPISRGKNWGYGDATAPRDGYLIVDLSRMDRILEVNEDLAYAVIEPGVTQGQLHAYLEAKGLAVWMDTNGAGPDVSLVGNILERGFGHTPLGERPSQVCGLEVVLGSGERLETGFGHYAGARAVHTYKYGVGPALDGLFFQSNYGIVTRMGLWLMPKPEAFEGFYCATDERADLASLIDRLSHLRRQGVVRSCVHVLNPLRALIKRVRYPWEETGGRRPVSAETIARWRRDYEVGAWNATGGVYGPRPMVEAALGIIRETLSPFRFVPVNEQSAASLEAQGRELFSSVDAANHFLRGRPTRGALPTAGWRSRKFAPGENDPLKNGAGLLWMVPTLPATGSDAVRVEGLLTSILERHGFDVPITFTLINERTVTCTSSISFNREDPDDCRAATQAVTEATRKLIEAGYPPYRSGMGLYGLLQDGSSYWDVARRLKKALDPDGILSPGHYIP